MLRRTHLLTLLVAALLAAIVLSDRAAAQGTFGALPDPISSRDLNEYAQRLGLSDQQLLAISEPHARYLEQFRQLREREVEQFFDQFRGMRTRFDPSQIGTLEPIVRDFTRLMNRIRVLDEGFFGEMQGLLTDDQAERLVRVRLQRERSRFRSEATRFIDFLNPAVRVDLSEMIAALDLPPGELDAIDEFLASYEHQLTNTSRRVFDSGTKSVLDGLKKLNDLGLTEEMMNNPGQVMRMFDAFQQIWADVTKDLLRETDQLTSLNRRTARQLSQALPEDSWRLLREQYLSRAYPEAAAIGRSGEAHFVAALAMEDLPDNLRPSVADLAAAHIHAQDRLADQLIELIEQRRRTLSLMQVVGMGEDTSRGKMDEIRTRADAADESAIATLKAMLGPDLAEKLKPAQTASIRRDRVAALRGGPAAQRGQRGAGGPGGGRGGPMAMGGGMHRAALAFVTETKPPDRMSARDVQNFAARLNLDSTQIALLETLHTDYLARFETIRRENALPYIRIAEQLRREEDRPSDASELAEKLDEAFARLEALIEAVRQADDQFLDDVQIAVIDGDNDLHVNVLHAMRSSRERSRYRVPVEPAREVPALAFGGTAGEARVDVARVVETVDLERDAMRKIAPIIAQYEREAADLFRQRFESEMATHRHSIQFMQLMPRPGDRRADRGAQMRDMGQRMGEIREAARATNRALVELNRETLDEVVDLVPEFVAIQIEDGYYREAFPEAFHDPRSAEQRIQAALALHDLTETQRSRILEAAADYRPLYMELTYRIVEHHMAMAEAPPWTGRGGPAARAGQQQNRRAQRGGGGGGAAWGGGGQDRAAFTERMERMSTLEVLSFDRTELNERVIRQLRTILRPDQIEQLPQ